MTSNASQVHLKGVWSQLSWQGPTGRTMLLLSGQLKPFKPLEGPSRLLWCPAWQLSVPIPLIVPEEAA